MKTFLAQPKWRHSGIMLVEALVYLAIFGMVSGICLVTFHHFQQQSRHLRLAAEDVSQAVDAGERWRQAIREAVDVPVNLEGETGVEIVTKQGRTRFWLEEGNLWRLRPDGTRDVLLGDVAESRMFSETREYVTVWHWEVTLQTRNPHPSIRPKFSFLAVPAHRQP